MFDIEENLKKLPDKPGVYIHKDRLGNVIYVGKAVSLKKRVRQYFRAYRNTDPKVRAMISHIAEFEYITTGTEMEALILECNLIKKYMPRYNVLLRDDKTYPFIKVTTTEEFPRILKTRKIDRKGDKYFGPYTDAGAVAQMVELLNTVYVLKRCPASKFAKGSRPCLNYHLGQCQGICKGGVDREEYMRRISSAMEFLKGRSRKISDYLKGKMASASERMDYEEAARYRDYLLAAKTLGEKQRVVLKNTKDIDVVHWAGEGHVVLFYVRDGKLTGRETYTLEVHAGDDEKDVITAFLKQHYGKQAAGPAEILVSSMPEEAQMIEEYLSGLWPRKVTLQVPMKGEKKALMDLVKKDIEEIRKTVDDREENRRERDAVVSREVAAFLEKTGIRQNREPEKTYRIEAYDISTTGGMETVGAMVVFAGARPDKKAYRRFRIRTAEYSDDYGGIKEVLYRRFKRGLAGEPGFDEMPDLVLIDGGRGHLTAALSVTLAMRIDIPVAGMVKDEKHRTRGLVYKMGGEGKAENEEVSEYDLLSNPLLYKYIGTIQEEVHRFAITYHRGLRDKKSISSVLDGIKGVGPVKRNALLSHFGSIENIKKAKEEELLKVKGITPALAQGIREYFN